MTSPQLSLHPRSRRLRVYLLGFLLALHLTPLPGKDYPVAPEQDGPEQRRRFSESVQRIVVEEKFEMLEKMGASLREKRELFSEGLPKLDRFDNVLGWPGTKASEEEWAARLALLDRWRATVPNSVIEPIARGRYFIQYAWNARGTDWANTVSEANWKLFAARLQQARTVLEAAPAGSRACPGWYTAMMTVALGQSWPAAQRDKLLADGVRVDPEYYDLYFTHATALLPRWLGRPGEWQRFAESFATAGRPDIYARIAWSISGSLDAATMFADGGCQWSLMKAGFEKMMKDFPDSTWNLNNFAYFARVAGDDETARRLFAEIESKGGRHPARWTPQEYARAKRQLKVGQP